MNSLLRKVMPALFLGLLMFGICGARVQGQETDDQAKIDIYKRFVDNRVPNPTLAYQAARDYLQKYQKDKDQYTDYLQKWVMPAIVQLWSLTRRFIETSTITL